MARFLEAHEHLVAEVSSVEAIPRIFDASEAFEPIADVITYTCPWLVRKLKFFWRLNTMIWQRPKESAIIMKRVQPRGGCAFPAMVDWYAFAFIPIWGMLSGSLFRLAVMCDFDVNEIRRVYQGRGRLSRLPEKLEEPDTDFS